MIINGKYTTAHVFAENVETSCLEQIQKTTDHPAFTNPIAIMPDCHAGKGSVVGFTAPVTDKIVPATIGVDIGCGMLAACLGHLGIDISPKSDFLKKIDATIRRAIPMGFHTQSQKKLDLIKSRFEDTSFLDVAKMIKFDEMKTILSLGSLGGGNHFIEVGVDKSQQLWVVIHSGSRGFGMAVCNYWQKVAKKNTESKIDVNAQVTQLKLQYHGEELGKRIEDLRKEVQQATNPEMEYLEGDDLAGYLSHMYVAQKYASLNRKLMMEAIIGQFDYYLGHDMNVGDEIESIHNYIDPMDNILRKGACRSYTGEKLVIPFNMRDGILICEGRSNPDWNYSAPHGAGRVLSRTKAKEKLSLEEFKDQMKNICSTSVVKATLDEAPNAYKDMDMIKRLITPTVTVLDQIRPVLNVKAL